MRKRDDILKDTEDNLKQNPIFLEVLLDIRALLAKLVKEKE